MSWKAALPMASFALLYASLIVAAETAGWIHFAWRPAFWLVLAAVWIWWLHLAGRSGLSGWRAQAALQARLWLTGFFVATLAEPRAVRKSDTLSVVYALDVSDSMNRSVSDRALDWIAESARRKAQKDEAGLVVFGREAAVEAPPRTSFSLEALSSIVPKDATDLAKGLRIAAAVLPEGNAGRIVLISDGNQTEGEILPVLDELKSRRIPVDVLQVSFDYQKEVWLERLDMPHAVKKGETYEAAVLLSALSAGKGKLRLSENGQVIREKEIEYAAGKNRFNLSLPGRGPGYYEYVATLETPAGEDSYAGNNVAMANVFLKGERQILVVTDGQGDVREWQNLVAELKAGERHVLVQMSYQMPRDALSLLPYDLIVVANAAADGFDPVQMQAIHDAIYNFGTGFLMVGSKQTFGPGGYQHTVIEEALPVTMDISHKKVLPTGALVIVLDRSGSMAAEVGGRTKLSLASRGALLAMSVLNPKDYFSLMAVDTHVHTVVPMAQQAEREKFTDRILGLDPGGGGIYIYTSLAAAGQALHKVDTAIKHVILFADAADAEEKVSGAEEGGGAPGATSALDMAAAMNAVKITTTVVALGEERDQDTEFLRQLAARGGGRFFLTNDATSLPKIFFREALTMKRTMLQEKTFVPLAEFPSPVLNGLAALPPLHGYVLTTPKPLANILLQVPPDAEELAAGERPDPVLATWRYGLGVSAAWTSDFAASWARDWMEWGSYRPFLQQLITELSRANTNSKLSMSASAVGARGIVTVEDFAPELRYLEVTARVIGPGNATLDVPLKPIGSRRYQGEFPIGGKGYYQVAAVGVGAGGADGKLVAEQALGGFAVPYSPEYLKFKSDPYALTRIARETGGRLLSAGDVGLFDVPHPPQLTSSPVFPWFLIVLACLIPLDVAVRRVHFDWDAMAGWFGRKRTNESTVTMSALLERKRQTQVTSAPAALARPVPAAASAKVAPRPLSPLTKAADVVAPPTEEPAREPETTTERLLARKRRKHPPAKD